MSAQTHTSVYYADADIPLENSADTNQNITRVLSSAITPRNQSLSLVPANRERAYQTLTHVVQPLNTNHQFLNHP
jgi:hypothetical protein